MDSDDSEDVGLGDIGDVDTAAAWLRRACGGLRSNASISDIEAFLAELDVEVRDAVVKQGNRNGKAALHFACQFRGGTDEGIKLMDMLMKHGADINVCTHRGHTPLIFAAGRGHSCMVQELLNRGANPRVFVVTGDTALRMGKGRLDEAAYSQLEVAEAACEKPWIDFRQDPDAIKAQNEHIQLCRHCRRKFRIDEKEAEAKVAKINELADTLAGPLAQAFSDDTVAERELAGLIKKTAVSKQWRSALDCALRKYVYDHGSRNCSSLCTLFRICGEERLGRALNEIGHRDRRSIKLVLGAILSQVEATPELLNSVSVADIVQSAECHLAMQLLARKTVFNHECDSAEVEQLSSKLLGFSLKPSFTPEVIQLAGRQLTKKEGGFIVTELLERLRWACNMEEASLVNVGVAKAILNEAAEGGREGLLAAAIATDTEKFPDWLHAHVAETAEMRGVPLPLPNVKEAGKEVSEVDQLSDLAPALPQYKLPAAHEWVANDSDIADTRAFLDAELRLLPHEEQLLVGVDTEWGDSLTDDSCAPSVIQIAVGKRAWVIDTLHPRPTLIGFLEWLCTNKRITLLGFAFARDAEKISLLLQNAGTHVPKLSVIDLQVMAMPFALKGRTPGLKHLAEAWLGQTLDKSQQCSEWCRRPLSAAQLTYAAADAAVLLDIAGEMGLEHSQHAKVGKPPRWRNKFISR